jgi:hypothetical protein
MDWKARRTRSENEYCLKINLKGEKRIWRLIAMRGDQTLDDLHEAIFLAFDRFDPHLYSFSFDSQNAECKMHPSFIYIQQSALCITRDITRCGSQ